MKKIFKLLSVLAITAPVSLNVISCGGGEKPTPSPSKIDLKTIIKYNNLNDIVMINDVPTKEELLVAIQIKNVNANLTINDFDFKSAVTATSTIIEGRGNYQGEIELTYTKSTELNKYITINNLDNIYVGQLTQPNEKQVKNKLKFKNPKLDENAISILNITSTTAKITGDEIKYFGEVDIIFNIKNFTAMSGTTDGIFALTTDKDGNVYAGGNINTLYKSNRTDKFNEISKVGINFIWNLTTDKDDNIYATATSSNHYNKVYKNNGTNDFTEMNGTTGNISALTTDKDGNVYAGGNDEGIIFKSNGTNDFTELNGTSGEIRALTTDKDGNVYAGSKNSKVYKSNGTNDFTEMNGTSGEIRALTTDKDGNVYAGTSQGLYKSVDGINFTEMNGTSGEIRALTTDKNDNVYVGSINRGGDRGGVYKSEKF